MEAELRNIDSPSLRKPKVLKVIENLETVIDHAKDLRDSEKVNDPELREALQIVERFIRRKHRLCYGGMAINALLKPEMKFYDFSKVLPDYDFFTPTPEKDVEELVRLLQAKGFESVSARVGMHEGTTKIFVNYEAVADISAMPQWKFNKLMKSSVEVEGVRYVDADFLRMNMYLELSRPRGEVERWDKVYKRLVLLNKSSPPKGVPCKVRPFYVPAHVRKSLLQYCVRHSLIFCGGELAGIYENPEATGDHEEGVVKKGHGSVLLYANDVMYHAKAIQSKLRSELKDTRLKLKLWKRVDESLPTMIGVEVDGEIVCMLIEQEFCYSFNTIRILGGETLRIASLDTLITLFYSLRFSTDVDRLVPGGVHCFANRLVEASMKTRDFGDTGEFPDFAITCSGHQPTKASLLRAKAKRVASLKRRKAKSKSKTKKQWRN